MRRMPAISPARPPRATLIVETMANRTIATAHPPMMSGNCTRNARSAAAVLPASPVPSRLIMPVTRIVPTSATRPVAIAAAR
ncbi:hypothetical protein ACIBO5_24345 [Nonomuraea angiospora]|uniref:hypothetical protein n=1 Tax=Nonomuraea angiospora TaxID=46172 RepID=UPI0029A34D64|nr:hypothetical protein [Nonomuraea angiospora]MDX3101727.1 hypothetical protein [Nonomuraea angiospora]